MTDDRPHNDSPLPQPDQAAIDAFLAAHARHADVDPADQRAVNVQRLMNLLNSGPAPADRASRVDATIASVLRGVSTSLAAPAPDEPLLLPDDEEAIDAWMNEGQNAARVPGSLRDRARRVQALASLVHAGAIDPAARAARIERTLAAVAQTPVTYPFANAAAPVRSGPRLADLISVAAVLLLGASVVWPILATARKYSEQGRCQANLGNIASALAAYSADNKGALPHATAGFAGQWWDVGETSRSNSANMVVLPRLGYTALANFACPGNPNACTESKVVNSGDWSSLDQVSYSYRLAPASAGDQPTWNPEAPTIVMADASPVIRRARARQPIFPLENSANHAGRGQLALRSDGAAIFLSSPVYGKDNIWLPAFIESALAQITQQIQAGHSRGTITIRGDERPDRNDIMLAP